MDFSQLCKFYVKFYKSFKNKLFLDNLLRESFDSLQLKKQKLKTGSIKFAFKTFKFNNITIFQWFEMEYKAQPTADKEKKDVEKTLETLSLKKDLQTLILLLIFLIVTITYINYFIDTYITSIIMPKPLDISQKNIFITVFELILPRMESLNTTLKLICESNIRLSDFIEII